MARLKRILLADVPLEERMAAARRLAAEGVSPDEAAELLAAALFPSHRVHYVPESAVAGVLPGGADLLPLAERVAA